MTLRMRTDISAGKSEIVSLQKGEQSTNLLLYRLRGPRYGDNNSYVHVGGKSFYHSDLVTLGFVVRDGSKWEWKSDLWGNGIDSGMRSMFPNEIASAIEQGWAGIEAKPPVTAVCSQSAGSSTIHDVNNKSFMKRSKNGDVINTPMRLHKQEVKIGSITGSGQPERVAPFFSHTDRFSVQYYYTFTLLFGESVPYGGRKMVDRLFSTANSHITHISAQNAINSAYGNINVGDLAALVQAGEASKTIAHLGSTFTRFVSIATAIRRGRWRSIAPKTYRKWRRSQGTDKALSILDLLQDAWMEARYAWRPLIMDAQAAINLLKGKKSLSPRQTFRGQDEDSGSGRGNLTLSEHGYDFVIDYDYQYSSSARAGVLCEATSDIGLTNELNLVNIVDAAVDLTPYSFVLQWFVNLGGLLYHLRPSGSYVVKAAWARQGCELSLFGTATASRDGVEYSSVPIMVTIDSNSRNPGPTPTLFSIDLNLSLAKILDLSAMLRTLLSKR